MPKNPAQDPKNLHETNQTRPNQTDFIIKFKIVGRAKNYKKTVY